MIVHGGLLRVCYLFEGGPRGGETHAKSAFAPLLNR